MSEVLTDLEKFEIFRVELIKKIKIATTTYRRKWNKAVSNLPEPNRIGKAYKSFVKESDLCKDAATALVELLEAVIDKKLTIPTNETGSYIFPDMPNLVAIAALSKPGNLQFVGVSLKGGTPELLIEVEFDEHGDEQKNEIHEANVSTYNNDESEIVRVASTAEIDRWAKEYLVFARRNNEDEYDTLLNLWNSWLILCPC